MSVIASVIGLVTYVIRRLTNKFISPKWNYILWSVFIISLFVPICVPSKVSIYNFIDASLIKEIGSIRIKDSLGNNKFENSNLNIETINKFNEDSLLLKNRMFVYIIADVYFVYVFFKLFKVLKAYRLFSKINCFSEVEGTIANDVLEECKAKLKIKKNIKILKQNFIKSPSIMGFLNVKIFITDDGLELDEKSLKSVFMHELSHFKRKDNIVNALIMIAKHIYFYNPIISKIFKYVKMDIEVATDELALDNLDDIADFEYCETILKVATMCSKSKGVVKVEPALGIGGSFKELEQRINKIFSREKYKKHSTLIMILSIIMIAMIWLVFAPSSYGRNSKIELYMEVNDHEMIKLEEINSEYDFDKYQTVNLKQNDKIMLLTEPGTSVEYITYNEINLEKFHRITGNIKDALDTMETGKYFYEFIVDNGKNKETKYGINLEIE